MTYGWQCASWTCWVGVNTRFIFDIRSCFFFHTMFWRKKISLCFFFGFTSRTMRVVFLTSLDLLLTFTGEYYWQSTEALGYYYLRTLLFFQTNNNSVILFRIKWLISELLGFFWMYLVTLKVGRKKKLVKTLGSFQQQQKLIYYISAVHW